jgi:hypothetical protein
MMTGSPSRISRLCTNVSCSVRNLITTCWRGRSICWGVAHSKTAEAAWSKLEALCNVNLGDEVGLLVNKQVAGDVACIPAKYRNALSTLDNLTIPFDLDSTKVASLIESCRNILILRIKNVKFDTDTIIQLLKANPQLQSLQFENNTALYTIFLEIAPHLAQLGGLTHLSFTGCSITCEMLRSIQKYVPNLKSMDLSGAVLVDDDYTPLHELSGFKNLEEINLAYIQIGKAIPQELRFENILKALEQITTLKQLTIDYSFKKCNSIVTLERRLSAGRRVSTGQRDSDLAITYVNTPFDIAVKRVKNALSSPIGGSIAAKSLVRTLSAGSAFAFLVSKQPLSFCAAISTGKLLLDNSPRKVVLYLAAGAAARYMLNVSYPWLPIIALGADQVLQFGMK